MAYVLEFGEIDPGKVAVVGGKGAGLAALGRIAGVEVPGGFCVSTAAFRRVVGTDASIAERIARLAEAGDAEALRERSAALRAAVEAATVPQEVAAAITGAVERLGARAAWAVRSSATVEDAPGASFAEQHDSFLDVVGPEAVLRHVRRCWASLFTERAVSYRRRGGAADADAEMAVVVQRMVATEAAGVLFTADPVSSHRRVSRVEATTGLGEALVCGHVDPDVDVVRGERLAERAPAGASPVLGDAQVLALARLGRRIEAHFGCPQDIEWCLADGAFRIVQSRPITTLFPIPEADDLDATRVYVSVGHQQMMTDPMKPLGLSLWQRIARPRMDAAAGRLFVDVAARLAAPGPRAAVIGALGTSDPLIGDALQQVVDRGDIVPPGPDGGFAGLPPGGAPTGLATDPAVVAALIERSRASVAAAQVAIGSQTGAALLDAVLADIAELKRSMSDPGSMPVITAAFEATAWLNEHLEAWLGEVNAADALTQSAPGNVTSEMGLALLDLADAIRPYPEIVAFLERAADDELRDGLAALDGGPAVRAALAGFLDRYGMRCVGEIDIARPRWSERPSTLVPLLLGHVRSAEPGAGAARFERGRQAAEAAERGFLERLRALPDGAEKAAETKRMIDRVRTFIGYREYPKYAIVRRLWVYKRGLLGEAERLEAAGVLREVEDLWWLTLDELGTVLRTRAADHGLIDARKAAFVADAALTPPRVITSDGEIFRGSYRRQDVPDGALAGLPVSTGTVEGRARVVLDPADADLGADDILVTTFTDPSWTPVFVTIKGLVTEVGGLMTHGAVIAREYGLPAVVGVEHATRRIRDGQRIRLHGTDGYVELLS